MNEDNISEACILVSSSQAAVRPVRHLTLQQLLVRSLARAGRIILKDKKNNGDAMLAPKAPGMQTLTAVVEEV